MPYFFSVKKKKEKIKEKRTNTWTNFQITSDRLWVIKTLLLSGADLEGVT